MDKIKSRLEQSLIDLNINLNSKQIEALLNYLGLLHKWNKVYNLTSIRTLEEMLIKHVIDSLAIVPYIKAKRLIDVGSGGGLPGVVLAVALPELQVDMLDSNHKKTRFLVQVKAQLGLENSDIIHHRAENYKPYELYDGIVSRAFSDLNDMLDRTRHMLRPEGFWWAMKGKPCVEALDAFTSNHIIDIHRLRVPFLSAQRTLIELRNI